MNKIQKYCEWAIVAISLLLAGLSAVMGQWAGAAFAVTCALGWLTARQRAND